MQDNSSKPRQPASRKPPEIRKPKPLLTPTKTNSKPQNTEGGDLTTKRTKIPVQMLTVRVGLVD